MKCHKCEKTDDPCASCGRPHEPFKLVEINGQSFRLCPADLAAWEKANAERRKTWQSDLGRDFFGS